MIATTNRVVCNLVFILQKASITQHVCTRPSPRGEQPTFRKVVFVYLIHACLVKLVERGGLCSLAFWLPSTSIITFLPSNTP